MIAWLFYSMVGKGKVGKGNTRLIRSVDMYLTVYM